MFNLFKRKTKIFCIGKNKTGTTSIKKALKDLGLKVGNQVIAEQLLPYYIRREFKPIIQYCRKSEAFQDIPFSCPYIYIVLDQAFPNSKFILSIRDSAEQWYNSLLNHHSKKFGINNAIPTVDDLKNAPYRYKGFIWDANRANYTSPESDPYHKESLLKDYMIHYYNVMKYFKNKENLLVINVGEQGAYLKFCEFLNRNPVYAEFPWENKAK